MGALRSWYTWRGAPDCRCDVDIIAIDQITISEDDELPDTESKGMKTLIEAKSWPLGLKQLHQAVGNAVKSLFTTTGTQVTVALFLLLEFRGKGGNTLCNYV